MTAPLRLLPSPPPVDLEARGAWTPDPGRDAWLKAHPLPLRGEASGMPWEVGVEWGDDGAVPVFRRDEEGG
jgi:hypothetical protein